jgi:hypothetical protein
MSGTLEQLQQKKEMVFTVTINPAPIRNVLVAYKTRDGTATAANGDYTAVNGMLTFEVGETSKLVRVPINLPEYEEGLEYFYLDISWAGKPFSDILTATGTIVS